MSDYFSQSSSSSPIALKRRTDVVVRTVSYQGEPCWVCKEPLEQKYHRLNEQEYAIFCWLDGEISFDELKDRFELRFTPYRVNFRELSQVLGQFHEKSLVVATNGDQGEKMLEMGREKYRKEIKQKLMSIYAIKWKGFDPEVFLNVTNPYVRPFFSKKAVIAVMFLVLAAAGWLMLHYEQAMAKAPSLWSFLDPANWMTLGIVIAGSKLLHEFGHAYSFKRFGGEVHEIGVMIFFFMPTMYCNTSDSWMLQNKWARIAIALGGVYVELVIFSIATFVWWFAGPGYVQNIAINLMFVCSLSAVVINGNPLLKYDGYFVLSDLVEIPNLQKDSSDQIRRQFMVHGLGITDEKSLWISEFNKWFMLIYGIAAYFFRMSLMLTVAVVLVGQAAPYGLAPIAFIFSGIVTIVYLAMPLYHLGKSLKTPGTMIKIKKKNLLVTLGIVTALIAFVFVPLPYCVKTDCTLDGGTAATVMTQVEGVFESSNFRPGDTVQKGDVIVELSSPELERELVRTQQELVDVRIKIQNQQFERSSDRGPEQSSISTLRETQKSLEEQTRLAVGRCELLKIRAPISGTVIGILPEKQSQSSMNDERDVHKNHGNILTKEESTWLDSGTELCRIRATGNMWATLAIKQSDQDLIAVGQDVKMLFNSNRSLVCQSVVDSLSFETEMPQDLVDFERMGAFVKSMAEANQFQGEGAPVNKDGGSMEAAVLLARCRVDDPNMLFGSTGIAKIQIGYRSIAWRASRMIRLFINTKL